MKTTITRTIPIKLSGSKDPVLVESIVNVFTIPKSKNKVRTIYSETNDQAKQLMVNYGKEVMAKVVKADTNNIVHGFVAGRNCVTNAMAHVGFKYTLCFDLKDFFESVTTTKLTGLVTPEMLQLVTVDGAARQGLPSSPSIANLAFMKADTAITRAIDKLEHKYRYTRYADDLTISFDDSSLVKEIRRIITNTVARCGFSLNKRKTRLMCGIGNRRIITGIAVDDEVHPTRAVKRRLRAAAYQLKHLAKPMVKQGVPLSRTSKSRRKLKRLQSQRVNGLREWMQCKVPNMVKRTKSELAEVRRILKEFNLPKTFAKEVPSPVPDIVFGNGLVITKELGMMMGMSTFTNGWTSCHAYPTGARRKGSIVWAVLPNVRMAYIKAGDKTKTYNGIERPQMLARTLVYWINDRWWHGRIYGSTNDMLEYLEPYNIVQIEKVVLTDEQVLQAQRYGTHNGSGLAILYHDFGSINYDTFKNTMPYCDNLIERNSGVYKVKVEVPLDYYRNLTEPKEEPEPVIVEQP